MSLPAKIEKTPALGVFKAHAKKINEIIDALRPIEAAIGAGSVKITKSGNNWIISSSSSPNGGGGGASIPSGTTTNDMLYWNGSAWAIHPAPSASGVWVLGVDGGVMTWLQSQDCGEA